MFVWPLCLFPAKEPRWFLKANAIDGGVSTAGFPARARTDGGGYWVCEMRGIDLVTPQQIRSARAWEVMLDGGFNTVLVPTFEPQFAPTPPGMSLPAPVDHAGGVPFSSGVGYVGGVIDASAAGSAVRRATAMDIRMTVGSALLGGEVFSIDHPTWGSRRYVVGQVGEATGDVYPTEFRPPLREDVPEDAALNFDTPGCVMRQTNPQEFLGALRSGKTMEMVATFEEAGRAS